MALAAYQQAQPYKLQGQLGAGQPQAQPAQTQGNSTIADFINKSQGTGGGYDQQYQALVNGSLRSDADLQAQHDMAYGNAGADYDYSKYLIDRNLGVQQRNTIDRYGGTGTIHSSIYSNAANENDQQAQDKIAAAALRKSQQQAGYDMSLRSGETGLLNNLEGGQADAAGRAAQAAYQRQLDEQQAQYQKDTLDLQRESNASQRNSMQQQQAAAQAQAQAQQDAFQRYMASMQPTTYPNGTVGPPQQSPYPSDFGQQLQKDIYDNYGPTQGWRDPYTGGR